jgi:hypothetical protein
MPVTGFMGDRIFMTTIIYLQTMGARYITLFDVAFGKSMIAE